MARAKTASTKKTRLDIKKGTAKRRVNSTKTRKPTLSTLTKPISIDFLGKEVDTWQDMAPRLGKHVQDIEKKFVEIFKSRELPGVTIRKAKLGTGMLSDKKEYIVIEQKVGTGAKATSAVHFSKFGTQDLQIERRHFEQGLLVTAAKVTERATWVTVGWVLVGAGVLLSIVGFGLILIPIGIVMIIIGLRKDKSETNLVGGQRNESLLLRQAVDASIQETIQFVKATKN
jgi:hypothetical protein